MADTTPSGLNAAAREAWEVNAAHWDARMGEGNRWNIDLIRPAVERALELRPGEVVLDAGCGNGQVSRWLADQGANVIAFDFSERLIELARTRSAAYGGRVAYHVVDGADRDAVLALGEGRFDAVVSTMALMDMAEIAPLIEASRGLLKTGGRFVFAVPHPCFNTTGSSLLAERLEIADGRARVEYAVKVCRYKSGAIGRAEAMSGQPVLQYYFERPLEALLGAFFRRGFSLDYLEEPAFARDDAPEGLHWRNLPEIPPVLVCRLRPLT